MSARELPLLALETSTDTAALALRTATGAIGVRALGSAGRHGRDLIPTIRDLLREFAIDPRKLGGVAAGFGPGSYTGTRIGVTAAKVLAYAAGCPIYGLDSLEILAESVRGDGPIVVLADAQRGTAYRAGFLRVGGELRRAEPTRIVQVSGSCDDLPAGARVAIGGRLAPPIRDFLPAVVDPHALVVVAERAWRDGEVVDPWFSEPLYLRASAAEEKADGARA